MWQRQITFAPVRLSGPISPAVCGSWRSTTSSASTSSDELARVRLERVLVDLARLVVELAAVALEAVEDVVDPLGDLEELGVALDHGPARVDAGALRVADQREQQLDHAAALGGRADVPDRALAEQLAGGADAVRRASRTARARARIRSARAGGVRPRPFQACAACSRTRSTGNRTRARLVSRVPCVVKPLLLSLPQPATADSVA